MASARSRLGAARRGLIGRKKKAGVMEGILATGATVAAFAGTQAKKAKTAWGEYEAGYKELGGTEPIDKGGWFNRTFKGPGEGEVRIGGSMYDKANIQKAGSFLGSDAAAILDKGARDKYLERTAPGTKAPGSIEGFDYSSLIDPKTGKMVMSPEQYDRIVAKSSKGIPQQEAGMIVDGKQTDWRSEDFDQSAPGAEQEAIRKLKTGGPLFPEEPTYKRYKTPPAKVSRQVLSEQEAITQLKTGGPFVPGGSVFPPKKKYVPSQDEQQALSQLKTGGPFVPEETLFSRYTTPTVQVSGQDEQQAIRELSGSLEEQYESAKSDHDRNRIAEQIRKRNYQKGQYYDVESGEVKTRKKSKVTVGEPYPSPGERPSFSSYNRNMGGSDPGSYNYGGSFAKGGSFVTNGPQKILVGDNPGGRERVTVKPLSPKNDKGKFGRYGDDRMKMIDGQPAHISPIEENMSSEDIKKYGAGTINPVTGKKEYWLGTALAVGSSLMKGFSAMGNKANVEDAYAAAGDIYQEQLGLLGDVRTQAVTGATQQAELGFDVTQSQIAAGGRESTMGARTAMRGVQEADTSAISQAGLATSGTIQQKSATQAGDVSAKLKSDMTKLFETRQLAGRERDLTISTAKEKSDLAYRSGLMSAEEAYQSTLTGLEATPTTFMEGVFG